MSEQLDQNGRNGQNGPHSPEDPSELDDTAALFDLSSDIIETTDEEGAVHVFEKVQELEIDGQEYAILIYRGNGFEEDSADDASDEDDDSDEDEDEEVVVMRISHDGDSDVFEAIEDEAEFERVVAYIEQMQDEEDDEEVDSATLDELLSHFKTDESPN